MLVAAFQFHGILPGASLFRDEAPLIWVMIFGMAAANMLTSVTGLALSNVFVRITLIPGVIIAPVVLVLGFTGAYAEGTDMFGVLIVLLTGIAGLALEGLGYPRPPLLIGMILIPLAESNFHQALQLSRDSYAFLLRPQTILIFSILLLGLFGPMVYRRIRRRAPIIPAVVAESIQEVDDDPDRPAESYPRAEALVLAGFLAVLAAMTVGTLQLEARAMLFPMLVIVPGAVLATGRLVYLAKRIRSMPPAADRSPSGEARRPYWYILAWIVALPVLIAVAGVKIGIAVYLVAFMLLFTGRRPTVRQVLLALVVTAAIIATLYFAFEQFLGVTFRPGLLGI